MIELSKELYIFSFQYPFNICDLIMIKMISFRSLMGLGLAVFLSQAVLADDSLSIAEADAMIKEDLASTQVLIEVCPTLNGKNAKFDQNIQKIIESHLESHSNKSMTFDKIQKDSEYQSFLNEARQAAKETTQDEQKSVCNDVINYEAYSQNMSE
ncbi:MCR_0457 family protein [Acinetobacter albensis]